MLALDFCLATAVLKVKTLISITYAQRHNNYVSTDSCSTVSRLAQATDIEHVEEIARDFLSDLLPMAMVAATNSSNTSALEEIYSSLAERVGSPTSTSGFSDFLAALSEISIAEANACSSPTTLNVTQLVSEFLELLTQNISDENFVLREMRRISGEILCAKSQEQFTPTRRRRSAANLSRCPLRCTCPPGGINSHLVCACQFFACLDPEDHYRPIFGFSGHRHHCLAFVIDTTGSMAQEIGVARTVILNFLRAEENLNELGCYILVPFNDNGNVSNSD